MKNSLIQKYNVPEPRYTSYPTVPYWDETDFSDKIWVETIKNHLYKVTIQKVSAYIFICLFAKADVLFAGATNALPKILLLKIRTNKQS